MSETFDHAATLTGDSSLRATQISSSDDSVGRAVPAAGPAMEPLDGSAEPRPLVDQLEPRRRLAALFRLTDSAWGVGLLLAAFLATNLNQMPHGVNDFLSLRLTLKNVLLVGLFTVGWRGVCTLCGLYQCRRVYRRGEEAARIIAAVALGSGAALVLPAISVTGAFRPVAILYFGMVATFMLLLTRVVALRGVPRAQLDTRHVLVIGSGRRAVEAFRELRRHEEAPYRLVGFVDSADGSSDEDVRRLLLGSLENLEAVLLRHTVDEVLIALPVKSCYASIQMAIHVCEKVGVQIRHPADVFRYARARPLASGDRFTVLAMTIPLDDARMRVKRVLDTVGASLFLVLLSPVLLVAALAVKLTSPGPVIFSQLRFGLNRRQFRMYKFRTMVLGAEALQATLEGRNEADGPVFKIRDDPRVTPVGRFLRRASIDELPQLVNVLWGHMSLVGPRPLPPRDVHRFTEAALLRRFSIRPGITCLWQISGRSNLGFDEWIRLDLKYIDEWSLGLDLRILARTAPAVLRGDGAT
jgi:exopolysaccharide biosynthesis polyprenyl glycosylphosphotransferase